MTHTVLRSTALALLVVLAGAGLAAQADAQVPLLTGTWRAEGTNPDGRPYRSVVQIEQDGDTYVLRWLERAGLPVGVGIGMVRGEWLSVSYLSGRQLGVVVYRIEKGPTLTGEWTVLGADGSLYPETLSKVGVAAEATDDERDVLAAVGLPGRVGSGPLAP